MNLLTLLKDLDDFQLLIMFGTAVLVLCIILSVVLDIIAKTADYFTHRATLKWKSHHEAETLKSNQRKSSAPVFSYTETKHYKPQDEIPIYKIYGFNDKAKSALHVLEAAWFYDLSRAKSMVKGNSCGLYSGGANKYVFITDSFTGYHGLMRLSDNNTDEASSVYKQFPIFYKWDDEENEYKQVSLDEYPAFMRDGKSMWN